MPISSAETWFFRLFLLLAAMLLLAAGGRAWQADGEARRQQAQAVSTIASIRDLEMTCADNHQSPACAQSPALRQALDGFEDGYKASLQQREAAMRALAGIPLGYLFFLLARLLLTRRLRPLLPWRRVTAAV